MHIKVYEKWRSLVAEYVASPTRVLEIGGRLDETSLLRLPEFASASERICVNLEPLDSVDGITGLTANANDLSMLESASFSVVLSNATLEHDPRFWLTVAEMRRLITPGGLFMLGLPAFLKDKDRSPDSAVPTFNHHGRVDYYRFSRQAYKHVFFHGYEQLRLLQMMKPPRLLGVARRPAAEQ